MGLAEDRTTLMEVNELLGEALQAQAAVAVTLHEALIKANRVVGGYDNVELLTAVGMIAQSHENSETMAQWIAQSQQAIDDYIGRIS